MGRKPWEIPIEYNHEACRSPLALAAEPQDVKEDKPAYLYYFGDHDPSGVHIPQQVELDLREFVPKAEIHFQRVAVTPEQIEELNLPTRPTKKSDTRSKKFKGESVELDAIEPAVLRTMVERCITQHVDHEAHQRSLATEAAEKQTLLSIALWQEDQGEFHDDA